MNPGDLQVQGEQVARTRAYDARAVRPGCGCEPWSGQLAIWTSSVLAYDGNVYAYSMVGQSPFNRAVPGRQPSSGVVIPLKITIGGFIFDPQAADDGCLGAAGNAAYGLTLGSPIFQNSAYTMNGVPVGNTQYVDAFQRANFWSRVQLTGNSYHTITQSVNSGRAEFNLYFYQFAHIGGVWH